jgi:hypothetical protein
MDMNNQQTSNQLVCDMHIRIEYSHGNSIQNEKNKSTKSHQEVVLVLCLTMLRNCFIGKYTMMHKSYHLCTTQNKTKSFKFFKVLSNLTYTYSKEHTKNSHKLFEYDSFKRGKLKVWTCIIVFLFYFIKWYQSVPVLRTHVHSTYLPKPYILDQHWFGPRFGSVPILVGSFFPKREFLVSISILKCFLVSFLCICLSSILQIFIPCIIGFGTLFQIQKLVGPILKVSLIWELDSVWNHIMENKKCFHILLFCKGIMFELQPCDNYEQWSISLHIMLNQMLQKLYIFILCDMILKCICT